MTTLNRRAFLGVTPFAVGAALQTFAAFNTSRGSGRLTASLGAGGHTLFVNIQTPGMTLAIWGPWERGTL